MSDRLFSAFLALIGIYYGFLSTKIEPPFSYDPLGPRPIPFFLAALLVLFSLLLMIRPRRSNLPRATISVRISWLLATLLFYQLSWTYLGFLLSTTLSLYFVSRLFHCTWMQGLMTALILSVLCYGVFHFLLDAQLPLGSVFTPRRL